jgi:peroxiredoxin
MTRRQLLIALAAVTLLTAPALARGDSLAIGQPAPMSDTPLKSVKGGTTTIARAAGPKGTLVVFSCNHCPWVKMWQTRIAKIGNEAAKQGIGVLAINSNDPSAYPEDSFDQMKKRAKQLGFQFAYVMDETSDVGRAFGATRTPEAFLFGADGKLVYHGTVDDSPKDEAAVQQPWLRQAVDAVVAGTPVPTAETKALGCSIKLREKSSM